MPKKHYKKYDSDSEESFSGIITPKAITERTDPLEEVRPCDEITNYYFSVTLNYPRTVQFMRLTQNEQIDLYRKKFNKMIQMISLVHHHLNHKIVFEHCKSGQIHAHVKLLYTSMYKFHTVGAMSDIVKAWKRQLSRKAHFNQRNFIPEYCRYRDPDICIQWEDTMERQNHWDAYMLKEQ